MVEKQNKSSTLEAISKRKNLWIRILVEGVLIVLMLVLLGLMVLIWRIHDAPLDIDFAKPYVEQALRNDQTGRYAKIGRLQLHWPKLIGPILLGLEDALLQNDDGRVIAAVDEAAVGLLKSKLFVGKIAPSILILKHPSLRVVRAQDGSFDFGFGGDAPLSDADIAKQSSEQADIAQSILSFIAQPGDQNYQESPLAGLTTFRIEKARLLVEDHVYRVSWLMPRFDAVFQSADHGLKADLYVDLPGEYERAAFVKSSAAYNYKTREITASFELQNFDTSIVSSKIPELSFMRDQSLVFDAQFDFTLDEALKPIRGDFKLSSASGSFQHDALHDAPTAYKELFAGASYDVERKAITLSKAHVMLGDVKINASADIRHDGDRFFGPLEIVIDEINHDQVTALWPKMLRGDNSETWIVKRMSDGVFNNVRANMNMNAQKSEGGWDFKARDILAQWDFKNLTVNYRAPMTPVTQAKGRGVFDNRQEKLDVYLEDGKLGTLDITKAELELANIIAKGKGKADINIKLNGPLHQVLDFVSKDPINAQHSFDLSKVKGDVDAAINLVFPTTPDLRAEDVSVYIVGEARAVMLPDVVSSLDLSGGPFKVKIKDNLLTLSGAGALEGQAVDLRYETFLNSAGQPFTSRIKVKALVTEAMRKKLGIDLSDFITGPTGVDVLYSEYSGGKSEAVVDVDLKTSDFFIEAFAYKKPAGESGSAKLKAMFENDGLTSVKELSVLAPRFTIETGEMSFQQKNKKAQIQKGRFDRFKINESAGDMQFEILPDGQMNIILKASALDLRPFLDAGDKKNPEADALSYSEPPMLISITAYKMITADGQFVRDGKMYLDIDRQGKFNQLEMDAKVGAGDIYLRYKPDETGKRVFRLSADDAGATLKAFGLYDEIVGGKLDIYGAPIRGVFDRNLKGKAEVTDFKVVNAPGLARLLGAMSLNGAVSMLSGEGVTFTKLEADFDWLYRLQGSLLVLKNGRSSGNSLGLTFDGTFDSAAHNVDVSGTIVPLAGVNKAIGSIPIVGDILTGGGALIAATYTLKGPSNDPKVSVNPLSVLAPGILRKILFEKN